MEARKGVWASFLSFFAIFARIFGRRRGNRVEKFSMDFGTGPKPPRLSRGHKVPPHFGPQAGNRWWRRQLSMRGTWL